MIGLNSKIFLILPVLFCLSQARNNTFFLQQTKCQYNSVNSQLTCNSSKGVETCGALVDSLPFNFTLFAIGELKATTGKLPLVWFRLHPRKLDNSGWWYYKHIKDENKKMSLHNKDKVSKYDTGLVVLDPLCWNRMIDVVKSSSNYDTIQAEKYNYGIFSKPYNKVKMIGTLEIL